MRKDLAVIAAGGIVSLAGVALYRLAGIVSKIILGRFGPENYGAFSIALGLFTILGMAAVFGFELGIARFGAGAGRRELSAQAATAFRITLPLSIVIAAALWSLSWRASDWFSAPALGFILRWFSLALPLSAFSRVVTGMLAARRAVLGHAILVTITESIVRLAFLIALIALGWGILGGVIAYVAGFAAVFVAAIACLRAYRLPFSLAGPWEPQVLAYAAPLFGVTFLTMLLSQLDTFMLGALHGAASAGIYNAAVPFTNQLLIVAFILMPFFVPTLAARARRGQPLAKLYQQITKWTLAFALPLAIFLIAFATPLVMLLFGDEYVSSVPVLRILAIAYFLHALTLPSRELIRVRRERMHGVFAVTVAAVVTDTLLNLALIPAYGTLGAGIASLATMTLMSAAWVFWARAKDKVWPLAAGHSRVAIATALAFALTAIAYFLTLQFIGNWAVIPAFAAFAAAYLPALFLCRALDREDKHVLSGIIKRFRLPVPLRWLE
jgi:O-antigen/teichoic acid export membrane protein